MIDWRHWHNEPYLVGGLIVLAWLYALAIGPLREWLQAPARVPRGQAAQFYAALILFYLAVGSPLDQIGERFLLSAHMLQHQLLIYPAAILLLRGLPAWFFEPVASRAWLRRPLWFLTRPLVAGMVYVLVLTVWHVPFLYDFALQNKTVHVAEHLMFFGSALLFWWPFFSPSPAFPRASPGVRMAYLTAITIGMTPLFAFIVFSTNVLYPTYEFAPRVTSLGPLDDQILAGTMMKIGGLLVSLWAFGLAFYDWYRTQERESPAHPVSRR